MVSHEAYYCYHAVNLEAQAATASSVQLVLILFDSLFDELTRIRSHIQNRRFECKGQSVNKCIDILNGLSSALDLASNNEVVMKLARLYDHCICRLYQASAELDSAAVDEVVQLLQTLKGGWVGIHDYYEQH